METHVIANVSCQSMKTDVNSRLWDRAQKNMEKDIATAFTYAVLLFRKYPPSSMFYITFLSPSNRAIYLIAVDVMMLIPSCVQRMGGGSLQYNTTVGELIFAVPVHKCADCWLGVISSLPLL